MLHAFAHAFIRTLRAASDSASFVFRSTLLAFTRSISDCVSSFSTLYAHTALNLKHMYTHLQAAQLDAHKEHETTTEEKYKKLLAERDEAILQQKLNANKRWGEQKVAPPQPRIVLC